MEGRPNEKTKGLEEKKKVKGWSLSELSGTQLMGEMEELKGHFGKC